MSIRDLFKALADVYCADTPIERAARAALLFSDAQSIAFTSTELRAPFLEVMTASNAHPICSQLMGTPLPWAPPSTTSSEKYIKDSLPKAHVELLGPNGLVKSDRVRLGIYGMMPDSEYGMRTHPAEEIYIMLAGQVDWALGNKPYTDHGPGDRSHHPSMMPHANRTHTSAFMSTYVWTGDISTNNYVYSG